MYNTKVRKSGKPLEEVEPMELAKVTSKGQITIPVQIRRKLKLKDGDKVAFMTEGDKVFVENSTRLAIREAQDAFTGLADELGLTCEDDVVALVKKVRQEMRGEIPCAS